MKTAISIPDEVFESAERYAQERGLSRSALYTRALEKLLAEANIDPVTEAYNQLADTTDTSLEPGLAAIRDHSLKLPS